MIQSQQDVQSQVGLIRLYQQSAMKSLEHSQVSSDLACHRSE
jgi:hypothetical protein